MESIPDGREVFWQLVDQYEAVPPDRPKIQAQVYAQFLRELAVLALDTCGFTRALAGVQQDLPFLGVLLRLRSVIERCTARSGGEMLTREGDNFFAVFETPAEALSCAEAIVHEVKTDNMAHAADPDLDVSLGIGYGPLLVVRGQPPIGYEMNLACKLGEDIAGPAEIILTPAAHNALREPTSFHCREVEIGSLRVSPFWLARNSDQ